MLKIDERKLLRVPWAARRSNRSIKEINSKYSLERTSAEAEAPILWPPDVNSWLTGKDPDAGEDWGREEKGTTEDAMASPTQWTWVWVDSGRQWRTEETGMLQSVETQRAGHSWVTEQHHQTGSTSKALQLLERNTTLACPRMDRCSQWKGRSCSFLPTTRTALVPDAGKGQTQPATWQAGFSHFYDSCKRGSWRRVHNRAKGWGWGQSSTLKVSKLYPSKPDFKKAADAWCLFSCRGGVWGTSVQTLWLFWAREYDPGLNKPAASTPYL